jgi:S-sulfo-L-cysteine synthase (3-phospho-L-serine-dependent)
LIRLATGSDVIQATLALAGSLPDLTFIATGNASIRFLCPERNGHIAAVSGLEEAARLSNIVEVELYRKTGDYVGIEHDFRDRIGHVISLAPSNLQQRTPRSERETP